jgi:acyl carrier protein
MSIKDTVYASIKENFNAPSLDVTDKTTAFMVPGWDSFTHVQLVLLIEEKLNTQIDVSQTFALENVGELVFFFENHINSTSS